MQSEVTQMRVSLTAIERALSASSPAIQIALSSGQSNGMAPPVAPISSTELASVQHHLSIIHEELIGVKRKLEIDAAVTFSSGPTEAMPRRCVPVFYLSNSFKLSSCQPFTLLLRWVTPEPPAPAWRYIRNEMLPRTEGRRAQECLLTIYNGFMHALLGRNPNFSVVESNVRGIFDLAWNRMASACQWEPFRLPDRSVKTVYGWLRDRPAAMKILQDTKLILPDAFELQLALRQRDARDTSRNGQSAASNVGHSALYTIHHHVPCSPLCSFRWRLNQVAEARLPMLVTPPYTTLYHHTPPCSVLTAVFFQIPPSGEPDDRMIHVHLMLPPHGVPRNAVLYDPGAPRPPCPLRTGEMRRVAHDEFDEYVQANAPQAEAIPCWPCPFCVISSYYPVKANLIRHIRGVHDTDTSDGQRQLFLAQSDICCLVWCRKRSAQRWEAILQ